MKIIFALSLLLCPLVAAQDAVDIVRQSENMLKGTSSRGKFRMTVETPDFTRTMEMDAWWIENDKALIAITLPKREAGNKTLKIKNELWMYLRNTETTIKVPPSMMLQSWNGSDFTNDDLVRESSLPDDYTMKILSEEEMDSTACWKIEMLPKPSAPVVWGKLVHWIRKKDHLPARTEYFDDKGTLMRTMRYSDIRRFGNRSIPSKWEMTNNIKPGRRTRFEYLQAQFDVKINDAVFSFRELEKR